MNAKPGRIPCVVVTCRRTAPASKYPEGTVICCGKCWRLGDRELRRRWTAVDRELNRLETAATPLEGGGWSFRSKDAYVRHRDVAAARHEIFTKVVDQAQQARAGIG